MNSSPVSLDRRSEMLFLDYPPTAFTTTKNTSTMIMMMMSEENDDLICDSMLQCWSSILPSSSPAFIDLTDTKKSVRFCLDQNTVHTLPELLQEDYPDLYISEEEQEATKLEMSDAVSYFRYAFLLESRPKDYAITKKKIGDVTTTIGLEWRIWPDGRFQRRGEIQSVVLDDFFIFGGTSSCLARSCEPISKVSEHLARKRADRVVKDLQRESPTKPKQDVIRTHDLGRWMGIHSWMQNIPLLRQE